MWCVHIFNKMQLLYTENKYTGINPFSIGTLLISASAFAAVCLPGKQENRYVSFR